MIPEITFITSNENKLKQVQQFLPLTLKHKAIPLPEIQSLQLSEVIRSKTKEAFSILKSPVLVEDVSLVIHSLGRLPGPLIKWFLQELGEGICGLISPYEDKSAYAEVCYGFHDGASVHLFSGTVQGSISQKAEGSNGFGWDRFFIPNGYTITRGQMNDSDFEATSPRKSALKKFEKYLIQKYNLDIA